MVSASLVVGLMDTSFLSLYLIDEGNNDLALPAISKTLAPSSTKMQMCCMNLSSIWGISNDDDSDDGAGLSTMSMKSAGKGHCGGHRHAVAGTLGVGNVDVVVDVVVVDDDDDDEVGGVDVETFNANDDDDDDDGKVFLM